EYKAGTYCAGILRVYRMGNRLHAAYVDYERYFFEAYRSKGGTDEYINAVMGLTANWMLPVVIVLGLVGGVIGAYLGKAILKKHFVKAGIV
ncbi:hypothetical protein OBE_06141, partial [human gut metagenome]